MKMATPALLLLQAVSACGGSTPKHVGDFRDCVAAGHMIMESHPRRCRDPISGRTFVEQSADG
jgi:hypothetical protein